MFPIIATFVPLGIICLIVFILILMVTKKVSTPYCHRASYLGPHPPGRKDPNYVCYDTYVQTGYIFLETKFILVCGYITLKSVFTLLFAGEALDIKARPPNLKLLC